jgi:glycerophosphoryl diester phosphodiesterase
MSTAHGGEWNVTFPYDSMPAFMQAYDDGADAVKGDFRVSKDNIGMVMHSSPIEIYESVNCHGKKVEEMTAEECTKCQMEITDYTFTTVPDMLKWADNKVNVMFCVKESADIPRAISSLIENNATHRSFLEVGISNIQLQETNATPGWDQVYYVVNMKSKAELQTLFESSAAVQARSFLVEFNEWEQWEGLEEDVASAKAKGFRTFAATRANSLTATVEDHLRIYKAGIDVTYTYNLPNAVTARKQVNTKNHITPP